MPADRAENYEIFLEKLQISEPARWQMAKWLSERGYTVTIEPMTFSRAAEEWRDHVDNGDLHVQMRIETKQLDADFTGREDWPFGPKFIVNAKNSHDRAKPKPHAYIIVNRAGTHAAFVNCYSSSTWTVEKRDHKTYKTRKDYYFAPLDAVAFRDLTKGVPTK